MNITIDYSSDLPMYEQIIICVKENILCGKLQFNEALPSVRQLAKELNVSTITIKRAYMELEHGGFIYTVTGKGTFVNNVDRSKLMMEKNNKLIEKYKEKTIELKKAGISEESLIEIINDIYKER